MLKTAEDVSALTSEIVKDEIGKEQILEVDTFALVDNSRLFVLLVSGAGVLLGSALAWVSGRKIAKPIVGMTGAMKELATGR
jgi:hypothetical protein